MSPETIARGFGYAWVPVDNIRAELEAGTLAILPMQQGSRRARLMLGFGDAEFPGRDAVRLADIIRDRVARELKATK